MYTLKSILKRGSLLGAAGAMLAAAILPGASAFADSLNPLTDRSLLLSSSAPGYTNTDGSGNATFAQPGSGPNGQKTGETFSFKVSTPGATKTIKAFTLQYCTGAAGYCQAPGNNQKANPDYDPADNDAANTAGDYRNGTGDYNASTNDQGRPDNAMAQPLGFSDLDVVGNFTEGAGAGQFQVLVDGVANTGWTMTTANEEDDAHTDTLTGKNNYITLVNTLAGSSAHAAGDEIKIIFKPSASAYITNPGYGAFFVKLNTYSSATDQINPINDPTPLVTTDQTVIDGGVTVANVMTDSIHITTKVLETMSFSVGTQNRDTVIVDCDDAGAITSVQDPDNTNPKHCESSSAVHTKCDPVQNINNNRLNLGNPNAEYSLETGKAWDVNSYWRLSSNSSGGATVYYSGDTLQNTVGDDINEIGATKATSTPGGEQFGLAFGDLAADVSSIDPRATAISGYVNPRLFPFNITTDTASAQYNGAGTGTTIDNGSGGPGTASFAFESASAETPVAIAQQNLDVISCATAKMRYVANIGADTPAGVYTTKINYLAAPQY